MTSDLFYELAHLFGVESTYAPTETEALRLSELGEEAADLAHDLRADEYAQILDIPEAF